MTSTTAAVGHALQSAAAALHLAPHPKNGSEEEKHALHACNPRTAITAGVMKAIWPKRGARDQFHKEKPLQAAKNADDARGMDVPLPKRTGIEPPVDLERTVRRQLPPALAEKLSQKVGSTSSSAAEQKTNVSSMPGSVSLIVNNIKYTLVAPDPNLTLAVYLRDHLGLTGTKISCGEGGCGACMVYVARRVTNDKGEVSVFANQVNSCLRRVAQMDGEAVLTTEGLGSADALHPIQASMTMHAATQCGYCTPGWVMSMYGLIADGAKPTLEQIESHFDGNLCRCTGYRPIFAAMRALAPDAKKDPNTEAVKHMIDLDDEKKTLSPCGKGTGEGCSVGAKSACASNGKGCGLSHDSTCHTDVEDLVFDPNNPKHKIDAFATKKSAGTATRHTKCCTLTGEKVQGATPSSPFFWTSNARTLFLSPSTLADVHTILSYYTANGEPTVPPIGGVNDVIGSALDGKVTRETIRLQVGGTSEGVSKYYKFNAAFDAPTVVIDMSRLSELKGTTLEAGGLRAHAGVTIKELMKALDAAASKSPYFTELTLHMSKIASDSVRAIGAWAGNLALAKAHPDFPSDLQTILSAAGATLTLASSKGTREVSVAEWQKTQTASDELIRSILIPFLTGGEATFRTFKTRSRHQLAHPIINAAMKVDGASTTIVYGGVADDGIWQPKKTIDLLRIHATSASLNRETAKQILQTLRSETDAVLAENEKRAANERKPIAYLNKGETVTQSIATAPFERLKPSPEFVRNLVLNLMFKCLLHLHARQSRDAASITSDDLSYAYEEWRRPLSSGVQNFTDVDDPKLAPVGLPLSKVEGDIQCTGEAEYTDDYPIPGSGLADANGDANPTGCLYAAHVWSTVAHGQLLAIDATKAMHVPGVLRFISAEDIEAYGGMNECGTFPGDEEIFASREVVCAGQGIGMVVAETRFAAEQAATLVEVTYGAPLTGKPILSLDAAVDAKEFLPERKDQGQEKMPAIKGGNVEKAFKSALHHITGTTRMSGAYHFQMEPHSTTVLLSKDGVADGGIEVWVSAQGVHPVREAVARAINRPAHKVITRNRRVGGGFGGKLSRDVPNACAAAVCAVIMRRPIKSQHSRFSEQQMVGKRPGFRSDYEIGFDEKGRIHALKEMFYFNGGRSYDSNFGTHKMALSWSDNAYSIDNFEVDGEVCRTHTITNTSMRGPGNTRSIHAIEVAVERVAVELGMEPSLVRQANMYTGNVGLTPYKLPMVGVRMDEVWKGLQAQSKYQQRLAEIEEFNRTHRFHKRGIAMTPVKYNITYFGAPENHHAASLNCYKEDGSILINHTGSEMGQGLNTKVCATVVHRVNTWLHSEGIEFRITMDDVATGLNSSESIANGGLTGGSSGSETCCLVAIKATDELCARLKSVLKKHKKECKTWSDLIEKAYDANVHLQVVVDHNTPEPSIPFQYQVWCGAATEVEIDVLTGAHQIRKVDIVYDCGASLNPIVDIGQLEGGFMIGLGNMTTEEVVESAYNGAVISKGSWDYHIPSSQDIPIEFNISLLPNVRNPNGIMDSKAVAEPPVMLATSAYMAIRHAIAAARRDRGVTGWFDLPTPASVERIQLLCLADASAEYLIDDAFKSTPKEKEAKHHASTADELKQPAF